MFLLLDTGYLPALLVLVTVGAVGLWCGVLLEGYECARGSRAHRRLQRRCRHLEGRVRTLVTQRDHWHSCAVYWERAYRRVRDHEGAEPYPLLSVVPTLEEEDA